MTHDHLPNDDDQEESAIQFDAYGIKARLKPAESTERPKSWREVAARLNGHLMTITERLGGVVADLLVATGNLARGLGNIPDAIATRIAGAHVKADKVEEKKQAEVHSRTLVVTLPDSPPALEEQEPTVESVLNSLKAKGAAVEVKKCSDGSWAVIAVAPPMLNEARRLLESTLSISNSDLVRIQAVLAACSNREVAMGVSVTLEEGVFRLSGTVKSFYAKQFAMDLARLTAPDRTVETVIVVDYKGQSNSPGDVDLG